MISEIIVTRWQCLLKKKTKLLMAVLISYEIFVFISWKIVKTVIFNNFNEYKVIPFGLPYKILC